MLIAVLPPGAFFGLAALLALKNVMTARHAAAVAALAASSAENLDSGNSLE
jgi:hypothetical protein